MLLTAIAVYSANSTFWLETWPHDCGVMFTVSQEEGVLFEQLFCDAPFGANEHRAASFQRTIDCLEVDTNRLPMIDDRCDFAFSRHESLQWLGRQFSVHVDLACDKCVVRAFRHKIQCHLTSNETIQVYHRPYELWKQCRWYTVVVFDKLRWHLHSGE